MSIDVREVVGAIDAMRDAYEVLPDAKREIAELKAELAQQRRDYETLSLAKVNTDRDLHDTRTKLSATEGERDNYFLEAEEAKDTLSKLRALIGVEATKPEPVAEQVTVRAPQGDGEDKADTGQSVSGPTSTITTTEPGQFATSPLSSGSEEGSQLSQDVRPTTAEQVGSTITSPSNSGQSDTPFASTPATSPQSGRETMGTVEVDSQGRLYVPSQQNSAPTSPVNTQEAVSTDGSNPASGISSEQPKVEQSMTNKPYDGKSYYSKPSSITWKEWRNGGGECPSWALAEMDAA